MISFSYILEWQIDNQNAKLNNLFQIEEVMESAENIDNSATTVDKVEMKSEKVEVKEAESNRGFTTKYVQSVFLNSCKQIYFY